MSATKPTTLDQKLGQNTSALAQFTEGQIKEAEGRIVSALKEAVGGAKAEIIEAGAAAKAEIIKAAGYPERKIDAAFLWLAHRKYTLLWAVGLFVAANLLGLAVMQGLGWVSIP